MVTKTGLHLVPAVLTLALVACEDSITGIPDPVVEATPAVEAVTSVALSHGGCVTPGANLISWWPGDVDGDFTDIVGTNPIVRSQGTAFGPGIVDGGFLFNGAPGHFMEIDDAETLRPANFTVDLWAKRLGPGQRGTDIYGNMLVQRAIVNTSVAGSLWSYFISWRSDGTIAASVYFDNDPGAVGGPVRIETTESFLDGIPIFVALSVAGLENELVVTLYVNGAVKGTFDATGLGAVSYGPGDMVIGNNYAEPRRLGFHRTFDGVIDEIEISSSALTSDEIQAIYNAGSGGKCKTPEPENTAPEVDAGDDGEINEGDTFTGTGSFADPDEADSWTATVDYGDDSGVSDLALTGVTGKDFNLSHVYADDGVYEIIVTVSDGVADPVTASASIVVKNVLPTVDVGPDARILEGSTFERVGSFTDLGADTWTATVDYGDGSGIQALEPSGMSFELSHTYVGNGSGPFAVTVTVDDGSGPFAATSALGVGDDSGVDETLVTVVYPLTIHRATVKLDRWRRWRRWRRRHSKVTYTVDGRLPLSLLQRFDPANDVVTVAFAGIEQPISAGSFVRRDHKWAFKAYRRSPGVQRIDLHDDGRFKIQARGPFGYDLRHVNFREPVDLSLSLGPDIGEASIQLDRRLHFRLRCGRDCRDDRDGDDDDDDDHDDEDHRRKLLRRFFRRGR